MIYELQATGLALPDIFAAVPPRVLGLLLWVICAGVCVFSSFRARAAYAPLVMAGCIYTGLFVNLYTLVDEVSINLEHAYNLYHHGYFSMSPEAWVDGTVEYVYYLLHVPFAWSHASLIAANFWISYLVGLLHLPLLGGVLGTDMRTRKGMLQSCAFAISAPMVVVFSSGFGNGLVSLGFLAAIHAVAKGRESRSLFISSLLPWLRPDAVLLSMVNIAAIAVWRRRQCKRALSLDLLAGVPVPAVIGYYSLIGIFYGHQIPVPIKFKAFHPSMLQMLDGVECLQKPAGVLQHGITCARLCPAAGLAIAGVARRSGGHYAEAGRTLRTAVSLCRRLSPATALLSVHARHDRRLQRVHVHPLLGTPSA